MGINFNEVKAIVELGIMSIISYIYITQQKKLFEQQIASLINHEHGFKLFERINRFALLAKPFEAGVELSAKQDVMRYKIDSLYKKQIDMLFSE